MRATPMLWHRTSFLLSHPKGRPIYDKQGDTDDLFYLTSPRDCIITEFFSKQYKIVDNSIKIQRVFVYITYRQTPLARDSAVFGYHRWWSYCPTAGQANMADHPGSCREGRFYRGMYRVRWLDKTLCCILLHVDDVNPYRVIDAEKGDQTSHFGLEKGNKCLYRCCFSISYMYYKLSSKSIQSI